MIDKKINEKEAEELKMNYNHYPDKRKEIMKNINFIVEDIFADVICKDIISTQQLNKN